MRSECSARFRRAPDIVPVVVAVTEFKRSRRTLFCLDQVGQAQDVSDSGGLQDVHRRKRAKWPAAEEREGSERVRERLALPPAGGPGLVGRSALWGGLGKRSCVLSSRAFGHIDSPFAIRGDVAGGPP